MENVKSRLLLRDKENIDFFVKQNNNNSMNHDMIKRQWKRKRKVK